MSAHPQPTYSGVPHELYCSCRQSPLGGTKPAKLCSVALTNFVQASVTTFTIEAKDLLNIYLG